jgi:hypothetical protein
MGSREPVLGEFREIFTRVVCGWGQSRIVKTMRAPIQGVTPTRVLGCLVDGFRVDSAVLDVRDPRVVRLRGSLAAHVWCTGVNPGETRAVDVRIPVTEEIPWTHLGDKPIEAPQVTVTVLSEPACNWARPQAGSVELEAEAVIRVDVVGFEWIWVRAVQPGAGSGDDTTGER